MENQYRKYDLIYTIMLLFFAAIIILPLATYKGPSLVDDFFHSPITYETGWHTADGESVSLKKLTSVKGTMAGKEFSIYNTVPSNIKEGDSLCFRSKNIFFQVFVDGELLYSPYIPESPIYTKSYGTDWNYIALPVADADKEIEIRITYVYDNARACMDQICIAQPGSAILDTFASKFVAFITCVLLLFVGLLLIIADIPINMRSEKNHELRYLGLFAVSIAIWCTSETNLIQFYLGDNRLMQVVSCSSLMLIPIPMVLYLNAAFGFRHKYWVSIFSALSFVQFVVCWGLHFSGIADIHETLTLVHILLILFACVLMYTIIYNTYINRDKEHHNIYHILRTIGLIAISIATFIDVARYYLGIGTDSALFVRIGLLLFILCFGSSSLEKTINAVKLGAQTEFVSQLAYQDGLTGIGNRTAFEEHLAELELVKDEISTVGIVMFDVNDLKYVNDHLGHHYGDTMLVASADIIRSSFENTCGECFRIGGDEFAVLLDGESVQRDYEEGIKRFSELIKQFNAQPDKEFRISIAFGFAIYDESSSGTNLMNIYQQADKRMYDNKRNMKTEQIPPEEYYNNR